MQEYVKEIDQISKVLAEPLSDDPNILRSQLIKIEATHQRLVEIKRIAMHKNNDFKGVLSDYEGVLKQKLTLGQSLLKLNIAELTRLNLHS